MIKLPEKIKVANHVISVVDWETSMANAQGRHGEFSANELTIRVHTNQNMSHVKETLLHEIIHSVYWAYNIHDEDKEERIVTTMAIGLSQVMGDNPETFKYLNQ